jgi:inhibitor of KinA
MKIMILIASDQALLVRPGERVGVFGLLRALQETPIRGVVNLHPAYDSLLIRFDSLVTGHTELETQVRKLLATAEAGAPPVHRVVEIPVRYGGAFGPDLDEVARLCRLSTREVIQIHLSATYTVHFLGFVPGFAYMGSVPEAIRVPRLEKPRVHVPKGSVAVANEHAAIYPMSTPGGWRLLGRTDVKLFDPQRENLSLLNVGDHVRFYEHA